MKMKQKNIRDIIKNEDFEYKSGMTLDYPLYTESQWRSLRDKPAIFERGIYKYVPNQFWGLSTENSPYWRKAKKNPNGIGVFEALWDIWETIGEDITDDTTYTINFECMKGGKPHGQYYCRYTAEFLEKSLKGNNYLHEILYRQPTKLFVDIDVKCESKTPNKELEGYYYDTIDEVKGIFRDIIGGDDEIVFIKSEALGVNSDGIYKYSCHLIARDHYITHQNRKLLGNYLSKKLSEVSNYYVDKGLFNDKVKLKLPNQLKTKDKLEGLENRAQRIDKGTHLMDYVLQNVRGKTCVDDRLIAIGKKFKVKGDKLIREMNLKPVTDRKTPKVEGLTRLDPLKILSLFDKRPKHMSQQFHRRVMIWSIAQGVSFNQWFNMFSDYWTNPYLDHNRGKKIIKGQNMFHRKIWQSQWNQLEKKAIPVKMDWIKKVLQAQYPDFREEDYQKFNKDIIDADNIKGCGDYTIFEPTRESPHLPVKMIKKIKKKYILLSTGLGQGKTWDTQILTGEIVKKGGNVIYICNRIALKEDILGKFIDAKKFNLGDDTYDYKHIKSGRKSLPSKGYVLLTTLESLPQFPIRGYDLVVVDECEAVNMTFLTDGSKSTMKGRYESVANAYGELLTTAKKVIMCDGLMMKRTLDYIDDIEGTTIHKNHPYHTIVSKNKNLQERTIIYYRDDPKCSAHYRFMNDLLAHMKGGKRVYLFMPHLTGKSSPLQISRDKGQDVEGQGVLLLKNYFMKYCGLTDTDIKLHYGNSKTNKNLQDVNGYWKNGKLVLSTSCITNGVSYDNKKSIYDSVWLLTDSSFISARDTAQISARMRHLKECEIRVCDLTNGASPTMFNRPNYISRPEFKNDINMDTGLINANVAKWRIKDPKNMKHKTGNSLYWRWSGIINAIREKNIIKRLYKWEKNKKARFQTAMTRLHEEITREHYVRGSAVLIRMFRKLGIEVSKTIEPNKGDEKKAKDKFNAVGIGVDRVQAEWEYDNIAVLDDEILYEQYRFQNRRGMLGNIERYELKKRIFMNQFKDNTPDEVLAYMFDNNVFEGFKELVRGNYHLRKVLKIKEEIDWTSVGVIDNSIISLRNKTSTASLLRDLDFGGMRDTKSIIRKILKYYFQKKYYEGETMDGEAEWNTEGKLVVKKVKTGNYILTEGFYNDLNAFVKWFDFENPLTIEKREYPKYLPFTIRVLYYGGGSDIVHPNSYDVIDEKRVEKMSVNYWIYDEVKEMSYDREIIDKICCYNPYIKWDKDLSVMRENCDADDYIRDAELDNMEMMRYVEKNKWKDISSRIWGVLEDDNEKMAKMRGYRYNYIRENFAENMTGKWRYEKC